VIVERAKWGGGKGGGSCRGGAGGREGETEAQGERGTYSGCLMIFPNLSLAIMHVDGIANENDRKHTTIITHPAQCSPLDHQSNSCTFSHLAFLSLLPPRNLGLAQDLELVLPRRVGGCAFCRSGLVESDRV